MRRVSRWTTSAGVMVRRWVRSLCRSSGSAPLARSCTQSPIGGKTCGTGSARIKASAPTRAWLIPTAPTSAAPAPSAARVSNWSTCLMAPCKRRFRLFVCLSSFPSDARSTVLKPARIAVNRHVPPGWFSTSSGLRAASVSGKCRKERNGIHTVAVKSSKATASFGGKLAACCSNRVVSTHKIGTRSWRFPAWRHSVRTKTRRRGPRFSSSKNLTSSRTRSCSMSSA